MATAAPAAIDDVDEVMIIARVKGAHAAFEAWLASSRDHANGFAANIDVDALTDRARNKLAAILTSAAFGVTRVIPRMTGKCTSFDIYKDAPAVAAGSDATPPLTVTRNQPDAHFWIQMFNGAGTPSSDAKLSFQCDRCRIPITVASDCACSYEQMVHASTTLVCPAWARHPHNPATHAKAAAAADASSAATATATASSDNNKRQRC